MTRGLSRAVAGCKLRVKEDGAWATVFLPLDLRPARRGITTAE
jgi:hypothetical protein